MDLTGVLHQLAEKRPVFHSEADFQHALALLLASEHRIDVRLEVPNWITGKKGRLDVQLLVQGGPVGIELKYLTHKFDSTVAGERFQLVSQSANDTSRYDVLKDIARLELAIHSGLVRKGYVVCLSNDPKYWMQSKRKHTIDKAFHLYEGAKIPELAEWSSNAGKGTKEKREHALKFVGSYSCHWRPYSHLAGNKYGNFRFLVFEITEANPNPFLWPEPRQKAIEPIDSNKPSERPSGSRYGHLTNYLRSLVADEIQLSFERVAEIVDGLPQSAYDHSAFWSNHDSHPLAKAWKAAGWIKTRLDFQNQVVYLKKISSQ